MRAVRMLLGLTVLGVTTGGIAAMPPERRARLSSQEKLALGAFAVMGVLLLGQALTLPKATRLAEANRRGAKGLDTVLLKWTEKDAFTVRDLVGGGVCILGKTGAAKSSSSGYQLGKALVKVTKSGGLILASKPEDKAFWQKIFAAAGRSADLLIFEPGGDLRFNAVDYELRAGADSRELTRFFMTVGETLKRGSRSRGGTNEAFWEGQKERALYSAIEVIRLATGRVSAPEVATFLTDAATSEPQLTDEIWRQGKHCQYLKRAMEAPKNEVEEHDYAQALDLFLGEWPKLDSKVRSSITADIMGTLAILNSGEVFLLLSTETNVSPALMEQGKWILVNMPVHEKGAGGIAVMAAWKYATQRHVLRRHVDGDASFITIWCDEFQNSANGFDSTFLAESRSHLGTMVVLTQSLHSFHSSMGQAGGDDHETKALLSNFGLKVVHTLGDSESAKFCSDLIGRGVMQRSSFSRNPGKDIWEEMLGNPDITFSSQEHMEEILQPNEFMHGLRTGGPVNGYMADAILIKSGEPFSTGGNWLRVAFSQK